MGDVMRDNWMGVLIFAAGLLGGIVLIAMLPGMPWSSRLATPALQIDQLDLAAQRSMAAAAWYMVAVSTFSMAIGGAGLWLIAQTLIQARRSADAGEQAVQTASDIGKRQVRAYLVTEDGLIMISKTEASIWFQAELRNTGQSPAQDVSTDISVQFIDIDVDQEGESSETVLVDFSASRSQPDISATQSQRIDAGRWLGFQKPSISDLLDRSHTMVRVTCIVAYKDVFGDGDEHRAIYRRIITPDDPLDQNLPLERIA